MNGHTGEYRKESDLLGERDIPINAYWGIQTLRAQENFGISLVRLHTYSTLVQALGMVKKACALANRDLGHISLEFSDAIIQACNEIILGVLDKEFVVDMLQGGAGTSTNMNANEVIASRANEILGHPRNSMGPISDSYHIWSRRPF